ncbi:uncharacterized protein VDAG_06399 [Verticillium dahliae VdLs.17]|uniref:Uncharacterized protein n=1 Tax=Verticillium dahliae (strain VdLs.17 / ATCC MYA-4575 / FGSC 10137) TaxID=498257 RepID=G2X7E1_VERDV|nr:uncharacterized protein VDAG_06399 [Verticillium dahliae VdLs.17]EGY14909.1 hypothetical protein VDAG_06399 [Verticillium dahliae VdLs.17]KAH6694643.1 hypothetical protein EV126DRAFT_80339 [Verticillium dahliae]
MVAPWVNPVSPKQIEESTAALMKFFGDSHTTQVAVESVKPFLQSSREIENPRHALAEGIPQLQEEPFQMVDALPRRLEIACAVKNKIRAMALEPHFSTGEFADHLPDEYLNFSFTLMQFSVFLCMDLQRLEQLHEDSLGPFWFDQLRHIEALFGTCACEVGASDEAWNMLTMAPTQHRAQRNYVLCYADVSFAFEKVRMYMQRGYCKYIDD